MMLLPDNRAIEWNQVLVTCLGLLESPEALQTKEVTASPLVDEHKYTELLKTPNTLGLKYREYNLELYILQY